MAFHLLRIFNVKESSGETHTRKVQRTWVLWIWIYVPTCQILFKILFKHCITLLLYAYRFIM